jgi:hypothetical protein
VNALRKMGKAAQYSSEEGRVIAMGWLTATYTEKGTDQKAESFRSDMYDAIFLNAPPNAAEGTFHHRGDRKLFNYWRDTISKHVNVFSKSRRLVNASQPSGVDEQQKINMAVAIHMKLATKMDYEYKDYDPTKWKHYSAWLVVKDTPKFRYDAVTTIQSIISRLFSNNLVLNLVFIVNMLYEIVLQIDMRLLV